MKECDVIIIGAGIIGLTLANALAQKNLNIVVIESDQRDLKWNENKYDRRVSAINSTSQSLFEAIHAWQWIKNMRVSNFQHMYVWDSLSRGDIHLDCTEIGHAHLGHIIENNVIQIALKQCVNSYSHVQILYRKPVNIINSSDHIALELENQQTIKAKLLIGTDGAHSWVRERARIPCQDLPYEQTAIVSTVRTEKSHQKTAWQCFLPDSILAFLPLKDAHMCSIVWSINNSKVNSILSLNENEFNKALTEAFENKLGAVESIDHRLSFPLFMKHAKYYVQPRIALAGDAVRTIHPLAGQGVNLGLLDAIKLIEAIQNALKNKKDIGHILTLRDYERSRKADNLLMISAMDGFQRLFNNANPWLCKIRGFGLQTADQFSWIKNIFIRKATGNPQTTILRELKG